jgi:signal transduction histidine kinase/DNA-binding response OmpR family regulator
VKKRFYIRLAGKVIVASIIAIITVYTIHTAIIHAFEEITENIDRLARPNERLLKVNRLFRDLSHLNHSQQEEVASGRRSPSLAFINESKAIYTTIDTLRTLFAGDTLQIRRIDDIEKKLVSREKLFIEYLELQYRANANPDIRQYLPGKQENNVPDTNEVATKVVKVYETTTSTTVSSDTLKQKPATFFNRLFGRKQSEPVPGIVRSETRVNKEFKVVVDTIEIQRNDAMADLLESSMDSLHAFQLQQLARIQRQELELINTNSLLIQEINNIINTVEQEEIAHLGIETRSAFEIARNTISNLNSLAIAFIVLSILLGLLIISDISKSNRYRKQLEQANNEAKLEAEAKQRFLSNMSHEIRTPLQSIYGYTELARLQPGKKVDIDTIYHSAGHLLNVVNEVLDYAKVTSGRFSLEKVSFNPKSEISNVITSMQPLAIKKNLKLVFEHELEESLMLTGDPFRLRQIIYNLTGNAIKFTNKGEIKVSASIEQTDKKSRLVVRVADTGIGIPEKQLSQLFQEFSNSNLPVTGSDKGTGLGLSIVKKLIEIQNGKIYVESSTDKGSCFTVKIPYLVNEISGKTDERRVNGEYPDLRSKMVLVADDDHTILNLSSAILKKFKVPHQIFSNGPDLLNAFYNKPDALVFLDVHMPGMNGLEVCREIRRFTNHNPEIRIFALTAHALQEERKLLLDEGFDELIIKPFKESDILAALGKNGLNGNNDKSPVDIGSLLRMTGDDKLQLKMILRSIIKESRNDLGELKRSLDKKRYDKLALLVHRMAGRVGQAGAVEYAMALRKLEKDLQNGMESGIIKKHVNEALKQGDFFIKEIKGCIDTITIN